MCHVPTWAKLWAIYDLRDFPAVAGTAEWNPQTSPHRLDMVKHSCRLRAPAIISDCLLGVRIQHDRSSFAGESLWKGCCAGQEKPATLCAFLVVLAQSWSNAKHRALGWHL